MYNNDYTSANWNLLEICKDKDTHMYIHLDAQQLPALKMYSINSKMYAEFFFFFGNAPQNWHTFVMHAELHARQVQLIEHVCIFHSYHDDNKK